jgi:hypothetical protein
MGKDRLANCPSDRRLVAEHNDVERMGDNLDIDGLVAEYDRLVEKREA